MTPEMNTLLEQMRTQLNTETAGEAWGPGSEPDGPEGKAGEGGAENESDVWEAFDLFVSDMVDDLMEEYELDEDGALDFIFTVADDAAAAGKIPEIPSGDEVDDDKAIATWLGKAQSVGFERMVLDAAIEASEDSGD